MVPDKVQETKTREWYLAKQKIAIEFLTLLKQAVPNVAKKHCLMRLLRMEAQQSDDIIRNQIDEYFATPFAHRTEKTASRIFGTRIYPWLLDQFRLDFGNGVVSEIAVARTAANLAFVAEQNFFSPSEIGTSAFFQVVVHSLTRPRWDQRKSGFDFYDLVDQWQEVSFRKCGSRFDGYFRRLREIDQAMSKREVKLEKEVRSIGTELKQVDVLWMKDVVAAISLGRLPPDFPLQKGPSHPLSRRLHRLVREIRSCHPERAQIERFVIKACSKNLARF